MNVSPSESISLKSVDRPNMIRVIKLKLVGEIQERQSVCHQYYGKRLLFIYPIISNELLIFSTVDILNIELRAPYIINEK